MAEEKKKLRVPDPMTEPCSRYFWEQHQLIEFLRLISVNYQTVIDFTSSSTRIILALLFGLLRNSEYQIDKVILDLEASNKIKNEIEKIKMLTTKFLSEYPKSRRKDMENITVKLGEFFNDKSEFEIKHDTSNIMVSNESELKKLTSNMIMTFENTLDEIGIAVRKAVLSYDDLLCQMMLCREFDNFLTYITELLVLIFQTKPEALSSSSENVDLATILRFQNNMNGLISYIIEKRVNDIAYSDMSEINKYVDKKHGFTLFSKDDLNHVRRISKMRNIIVHNRSIINHRFLKDVPGTSMQVGERLKLELIEVYEYSYFLARCVCDIDVRAAEKFGLPQPISKMISNPWASI